MYRFLESVKLEDGKFYQLDYHQKRIEACFHFHNKHGDSIDLAAYLNAVQRPMKGLYKVRVLYDLHGFLYDLHGSAQVEFVPYRKKPIHSLQLVETSMPSLPFKPADRTVFNTYHDLYKQADELLFVRNGLLTDTTIANIALFDGKQWITPAVPLIYGTQRAYLIDQKKIQERDISVESLKHYEKISVFNAMIAFEELVITTPLLSF